MYAILLVISASLSGDSFCAGPPGAPPDPEDQRLIAELDSPVEAERLQAILALGEKRRAGRLAVPRLIEIARDHASSLRPEALEALGKTGDATETVVAALMEALRDREGRVRKAAVYGIRKLEGAPPEAAARLVSLLADPESDIKADAIFALSDIDPENERLFPTVAAILAAEDSPRPTWFAALYSLSRMGRRAEPALPFLIRALCAGDESRSVVVEALANLGKPAVPALLPLIEDPRCAWSACEVIEKMGPTAAATALPVLLKMLDEDGAPACIPRTLAVFGPRAAPAVPTLSLRLKHADPYQRHDAAMALGRIGPAAAAAVPGLVELVEKGPEPQVRRAAIEALGNLGPGAAAAVPALTRNLEGLPQLREELLRALQRIGVATPELIAALLAFHERADRDSKPLVFSTLVRLGGPTPAILRVFLDEIVAEDLHGEVPGEPLGEAAAVALIAALPSWEPPKRERLVRALAGLGPRAAVAVDPLLAELRASPSLRRAILSALGAIGEPPEKVIPPLRDALADADIHTRIDAAFALQKLGPAAAPAVVELARAASDFENPYLQMMALWALRSMGAGARPAVPEVQRVLAESTCERVREEARRTLEVVAWVPDLAAGECLAVPLQGLRLLARDGHWRADLLDNAQSPRILSGIDSLTHEDDRRFDAFDPDSTGASAGLNFEHVISGHADLANSFTPRRGPFRLFPAWSRGEQAAVLVRRPEDCPWRVAAILKYVLRAPHTIDFEFRCRAEDAARFGRRGYAVFFFANYMNDVLDPSIRFLGVEGPGGAEKWISADAPPGHPDHNHGGTYRAREAPDLEYDAGHNFKLNLWSYDYPRFTRPFYYGRTDNGFAFILMFDRLYSEADEMRFSLFKFKLPRQPRPAWDFQYVIHRVEAGRDHGFRGRLVWKPFVSDADCLAEYEAWRSSLATGDRPGPRGR